MIKYQASKNISNADEALELYSETHPTESGRASLDEPKFAETLKEPSFSDYYRPSDNQKTGEMLYVGE